MEMECMMLWLPRFSKSNLGKSCDCGGLPPAACDLSCWIGSSDGSTARATFCLLMFIASCYLLLELIAIFILILGHGRQLSFGNAA